ncbi:ferrochelatase [Mannheimia haemolytica]|nr:ferrochelatase [Mannheimia haemolytica]
MSFQSRFGDEEWLQPYTDQTLESFPQKRDKKVAVVCPGFSADCLETLKKLQKKTARTLNMPAERSYRYIPALNASGDHIKALVKLIETKTII